MLCAARPRRLPIISPPPRYLLDAVAAAIYIRTPPSRYDADYDFRRHTDVTFFFFSLMLPLCF